MLITSGTLTLLQDVEKSPAKVKDTFPDVEILNNRSKKRYKNASSKRLLNIKP